MLGKEGNIFVILKIKIIFNKIYSPSKNNLKWLKHDWKKNPNIAHGG
jgi:hypothetical protein